MSVYLGTDERGGAAAPDVVEQMQVALPEPAIHVPCVRESSGDDHGARTGSKYATAERIARYSVHAFRPRLAGAAVFTVVRCEHGMQRSTRSRGHKRRNNCTPRRAGA